MKRVLSFLLSLLLVCSAFAAYPASVFAEEVTAMTIKPSGFGAWENWVNSPNITGDYDSVTQLLVEATDASGNALVLPQNAKWSLTISWDGGSKTLQMNPATTYEPANLYRFETCNGEGENKFVPQKGVNYSVSATIFVGGTVLYKSTAVSGFTCTMDPIDPAVPIEQEPEGTATLTVSPYYDHIENYGTPTRTYFIVGVKASEGNKLLYARLKRGVYKMCVTVTDETESKSATVYYPVLNPGTELYGTDFMRLALAERGFTPVKDHRYTLELKVYDGEELKYSGKSAVGAFCSKQEAFIRDGAVVPELPEKNGQNALTGKSVLFVGDSITEAICEVNIPQTRLMAGWPGRIGLANDMFFVNKGLSGASVSNCRGSNTVINQLMSMKNYDFDLVIMHGGVNDAWDSAPVGAMTALTNKDETAFDQTTFAGGLEYLFWYATTYYPDAVKGYIINFRLPGSAIGRLSDMSEYFEVARAICDKWEIPYLDLYTNDEINDRLKGTTRYALGDYIHPNDRGYDILYPYVEQFCQCIMAGGDPSELTDPERLPDSSALISPEDINVALGKTAVSGTGTTSAVATDGSVDGYFAVGNWCDDNKVAYGTSGSCYVQIDLLSEYDIDKLNVATFVGNLLYQWEAYATTDKELALSEWTKLGTKDGYEMSYEDGYTLTFETTRARYIRIYGLYTNASSAFVFNEVSVYGVPAAREDETVEQVGGGSSEKLPDETTSGKLTDGNKTSDALTVLPKDGGSIVYDLGALTTLETIKTYTAGNDSSYGIYGSVDGTEWVLLGTKTLNGATLGYTAEKGWGNEMAVSGSYRYLRWSWFASTRKDGYVSAAEIEIFAKDSEEALTGVTVTQTKDAVYSGNNTIDGNYKSYCFLRRQSDDVVIDLGQRYDLRYVTLYPASNGEKLFFAVSENGTTWMLLGAAEAGSTEAVTGYVSGEYRYLKLYTGSGAGFSAYEIEAYAAIEAPADPDDPNPPAKEEELTDKEEVTITLGDGSNAGKLKDDVVDKNYQLIKENENCFVVIDLKKIYALSKIVVNAFGGNYLFEVHGSVDGQEYTKLAQNAASSSYVVSEGFVLALEGEYRYVKIVATGCQNGYFTVYEIDVYGTEPSMDGYDSSEITGAEVVANGAATDKLTDGNKTSDGVDLHVPVGGNVTLDLGSVKTVATIKAYVLSTNNGEFAIYGSVDGLEWTAIDAKGISDARVEQGCLTVTVNKNYRYLRVVGLTGARTDVYSCAVMELDALDGEGTLLPMTVSGSENVVYSGNINDGNYGNYAFIKKFEGTAADATVIVDLKQIKTLSQVALHAAKGCQRFLLETSEDGVSYSPYGINEIASEYDPATGFVVKGITRARYIRLTVVDGADVDGRFLVYEVTAYERVKQQADPALSYDLNKDGACDISDVTELLKALAGTATLENGDINGDGACDISDVTELLKYLAAGKATA